MVGWKILSAFFLLVTLVAATIPISDKEKPPTLTISDIDLGSYDSWSFRHVTEEQTFQDEEDDEWEYRLPNNSIPLKYDLWLSTEVDQENFDFFGKVKIHIRILETTPTIILHARQLKINLISLLNEDGVVTTPGILSSYIEQTEQLVIILPEEAQAETDLFLQIEYQGILRTDGSGFYRASYEDINGETVWFATTQFEMTDARHAMPCFDEPGLRAITSLSIQHSSYYTAISNMPVTSREPLDDNPDYVTTVFMDTPPMQSYLLAFIVSNYKFKSNNDVRVEQRVYARPQAIDDGECDFALSQVDPMLTKLEEYFGVPYPLPKMDHALIFDYIWGAMENFGLITYQERSMLYVEGRDSVLRKKSIIELIGHEYVHQYFGNIVNPKWWSYTWLNEGFATLFQYYISALIYPEEDHMERFQNNAQAAAFRVDTIANDAKPLNYYVETPDNIRAKFSTISYQKGGSVLRMFQVAITDETFRKGLYGYLGEMYYAAATPQDLHKHLQLAYDEDFPDNGINLDEVMTTWEDQAGYPLVHVSRTENGITMTQSRFGGGSEIYTIPISFVSKTESGLVLTPKLWMTEQSMSIEGFPADDWIIINPGSHAYYKVSYDLSLWTTLIGNLKSDFANVPDYVRKQAFIEMNPSTNELADVNSAFELMTYLSDETDLSVWELVPRVEQVFSRYLFGTTAHENYNQFLHSILQPHLTRLGWTQQAGESEETTNLRNIVSSYSCKALNNECLDAELTKLLDFASTGSSVPFRLCDAMRKADQTTYNFLIESMYKHEDKSEFIQNLGCSMDADILKNYLSLILDPANGLSATERVQILQYTMGRSTLALTTSLQFIYENYPILQHIMETSLKTQLLTMANYINDNMYYEVYKTVLSSMQTDGFLTNTEYAQRTNVVAANFVWQNNNWETVSEYLDVQDATTTTTLPLSTDPTTPAPEDTTTQSPGSSPAPAETTTAGASLTTVASFVLILLSLTLNIFN